MEFSTDSPSSDLERQWQEKIPVMSRTPGVYFVWKEMWPKVRIYTYLWTLANGRGKKMKDHGQEGVD